MKRLKSISIFMVIDIMLSFMYCPVVNAEEKPAEARVVAVGDNLIHSRVITSGKQEDGTYNYDEMYEYYKEYLESYDLKVVNQETVFVENDKDFSGYPTFGGPEEVGSALIDAGFNMATTATNHVMDKGIDAVWYSYLFWTGYGIEPVGTYTNRETYNVQTGKYTTDRASYANINGIRISMLNYTYGTNGISIPEEYKWMIGTLYDKELIKSEMEWAKSNSDILIVFPHWGTEYRHTPDSSQLEWAQFFADNGADIIIGTHPHVVEPLEYIEASDGDLVPCYYSLGNFISNQNEVPRMLGAAATFTIVKDDSGASVKDVKAVPTITHISSYSEKFYAKSLYDYTKEEESVHRMRRVKGSEFSIDNLWNLWYSVFSEEETTDF